MHIGCSRTSNEMRNFAILTKEGYILVRATERCSPVFFQIFDGNSVADVRSSGVEGLVPIDKDP